MALADYDRELLERCIGRKPNAWKDFVDRYLGLFVHVVNHTARTRNLPVQPSDRDDLVAEVFLTITKEDFAVLRHFRGQCSLPTYLAVIARRVVVRSLLGRTVSVAASSNGSAEPMSDDEFQRRLADKDEVERLLSHLGGQEAELVRLHFLESKSYREIAHATGVRENSIGPTLSRAKEKMLRAAAREHART